MRVEQGASIYDLIFTVVDGPPMDLGVELPDEAKKPLDEAKKSLQAAVDAGNFVISVNTLTQQRNIMIILM